MAHLVENMAYVGETPWHGLGNKLDQNADINVWAEQSGLNFELATLPVQNGSIVVPNKQIIYRTDRNEGLSVVGDKYKVVQPREVLDFFKHYVEGAATLETAGVLAGGKRYWALAKLDDVLDIDGDITNPYLLLSSSCDGSLATTAKLTSVRVVCNNTLQMTVGEKSDVTVRHTSVFNAVTVQDKLAEIYESFKAHKEMLTALANTKLTNEQATEFIAKLFLQEGKEQFAAQPARILELYHGAGKGADLASSKGTAYGLLQAVTQYSDWEAGRSQDTRLFNAWFGRTADKKMAVANELYALAA